MHSEQISYKHNQVAPFSEGGVRLKYMQHLNVYIFSFFLSHTLTSGLTLISASSRYIHHIRDTSLHDCKLSAKPLLIGLKSDHCRCDSLHLRFWKLAERSFLSLLSRMHRFVTKWIIRCPGNQFCFLCVSVCMPKRPFNPL